MPTPPPQYNAWFPETAATNHFIADFKNLNLDCISYQGSNQVSIRDGSSLLIQHTGSAHLRSSTGNFLLSHILHIPSIAINLLSVHQFCLDNFVYFKFHSNCFFVKDLHNQKVLLQGTVENGLYVLPHDVTTSTIASPQAFLGEKQALKNGICTLVTPQIRSPL